MTFEYLLHTDQTDLRDCASEQELLARLLVNLDVCHLHVTPFSKKAKVITVWRDKNIAHFAKLILARTEEIWRSRAQHLTFHLSTR